MEKAPSNLPDFPGRAPQFLAQGAVLVGLIVLAAWTAGFPAVASRYPGFPRMCRTTAVGFIVAGLSLWFTSASRSVPTMRLPGFILAVFQILLGGFVLGEHLLGPAFDSYSLTFGASGGTDADGVQSRVAVSTALSFVLSGTALLMLDWVGPRGLRPSQHLALAVIAIASLSLSGYVLNEPLAYSYFYTGMALSTSLTFILLGTGILLARPGVGIMGVFLSPRVGGKMIRRLLPPIVVVLPLLGWLEVHLHAGRILAHEIIEPISAVIGAVAVAAILWMFARELNREDEQRLKNEATLRESEENFRTLTETARDGIVVAVGKEARYVFANPEFSRMLGYPAEELIGGSFRDFVAPEELAKIGARYERLKAGERLPAWHETIFVRKDGTRVPVEVTDAEIGWNGEPAVFAIVRDVSERVRADETLRESEENFRALADNANDSIIVAVEPERHAYANRPAAEMIGYTVEELLAKTPRDIVHPDEYPKLAERLRKRLAGENVPTRYATVVRHKDGRLVPVEVTAARTTWRGRPASIVVTRDMTERRQAEEERAALYQQNRALLRRLLDVQEEERKGLAQEIHDDLGQSLTAIMTNARLIAKNCPKCQPAYVEAAREIVSIADGVYDSVQRMSRRLRPSALDDLGLMDALRTMVETSPLKRAGVDFTISFGGELYGLEDPVNIALYRILQECLTNIAKHSGADHVTIALRRTSGGAGPDGEGDCKGETVSLVIEDNGRGIDSAGASKGLGLIGIRERVETLGGEFRLFSGPGKGTSVRVALPVSRSTERAGV